MAGKFLTPLSKIYGDFEYTKDTNDLLIDFSKLNDTAERELWNFDDIMLFGIDVQALYPSVKFKYLKLALLDCFEKCTNWSSSVKTILIDIIMYTVENQQIFWNNTFYLLNKGIPTGGKHCVPLANILLTFIMIDLLRRDSSFSALFNTNIKLWKRYIDDCGGVFLGRNSFQQFFDTLNNHFNKFDLNLTHEVSTKSIHLLDIEVFIDNGQFHTKEYRKVTACNSYIKFGSAHPKHCFRGIIKSQMLRLRRLCSRDCDFHDAIAKLKERCINSGYDIKLVDNILLCANSLERVLTPKVRDTSDSNFYKIRWVVLSGTPYEKQITEFVRNLNSILFDHGIKLEIVKSTGSSIGQLLFNNNIKSEVSFTCSNSHCSICKNSLRPDEHFAISPTNGRKYSISPNINCENCGIYAIKCPCSSLYTGKTTTTFVNRFNEHFTSKSSSIYEHCNTCTIGREKHSYSVQFLENVFSRGKYTLSEREYLWNERLRGLMNVQKTLKK